MCTWAEWSANDHGGMKRKEARETRVKLGTGGRSKAKDQEEWKGRKNTILNWRESADGDFSKGSYCPRWREHAKLQLVT